MFALTLFKNPGDLIQFQKPGYIHWAVLVRDYYIIHVQAPDGGKTGNVIIAKMKLSDYLAHNMNIKNMVFFGCWASVNNNFDKVKKPFPVDEIIRRAESMVGKKWYYDLYENNCEHFAHWCRYGMKVCKQSPNKTEYEDDDGNVYACGQVGGTNLGPVEVKVLNYSYAGESEPDRSEYRSNAEIASVGVGNLARASVAGGVTLGHYNSNAATGFKAEVTCAEANVGPVNAKVGLGVSTGIGTKDGVHSFELLGTGWGVNSERLEVKVLGSSVAVKWPWNWFD